MYFSSFLSDLLSFFKNRDQDSVSFLLFYKCRSNQTHIEPPLIGKQILTKCGAFFFLWLTWRWNAGNLETTSWSFQWANFGRAAWFSWISSSCCSDSCNCCCSCCSTAGSSFSAGTWKSQIKHEPGLDFWKVSFDQLDWGFCDSGCF